MSMLNELNSHAGEPLSRQISYSLVTPQSLTGYKDFFRQNTITLRSYMFVKTEGMNQWEKKWVVFEDNEVRYGDQASASERDYERVSMDRVVNLTADQSPKDPTIKITTTEGRLLLKLDNLDQMRDWLFCFQKSAALVLTHILESKAKAASYLQAQLEDSSMWMSELGNGHGRYQNLVRRHSQAGPALASNRALTMEDLGFRNSPNIERDIPFPASKWAERKEPPTPAKIIAVSPAIPITLDRQSYDDDYDRRERVASSFKEDVDKYSPLEEMLHAHPIPGDGYDYEDVDGNDSASDGSGDGDSDYMMFEMDEAGETKTTKDVGRTRSASRSSDEHKKHLAMTGGFPGSSMPTANTVAPSSSYHASSLGRSLQMSNESMRRGVQKRLRWRSGHCSKLGPRNVNEDRFVSVPSLPCCDDGGDELRPLAHSLRTDNSRSLANSLASNGRSDWGGGFEDSGGFFGVYDGHCGDQASTFLQNELLDRICAHPLFWSNLERAIMESCITLDKEFLELCRKRRQYCGTTALGAFIFGSTLTVFNIGDSMAVLCSAGVASEMSDSHKPGRSDEAERIRRANGWITEEKELYMARLHRMDLADPLVMDKAQNMNWVTIHRVCGELAVSRSIGDPDYKSFTPGAPVDAFFAWPEGHDQVFLADLVIPDPECKCHEITVDDEFLILASDGMWDVISPAEVVQYVRRGLAGNKTPSEVAEELCDLSIRLGSSDNVTVVLVQFLHQ